MTEPPPPNAAKARTDIILVSVLYAYFAIFFITASFRRKYSPLRQRPMFFLMVWSLNSLVIISKLLVSASPEEQSESHLVFGWFHNFCVTMHHGLIAGHFIRLYFISRVDQYLNRKEVLLDADTLTDPSKASWAVCLMVVTLFCGLRMSLVYLFQNSTGLHVAIIAESFQTLIMFAILSFVLCQRVVREYRYGRDIKTEILFVSVTVIAQYFAQYARYMMTLSSGTDESVSAHTYAVTVIHTFTFTLLMVYPTLLTFRS
jgi:hypothetical protein